MTGLQIVLVILASFSFLKWLREFVPAPWGHTVNFVDNWLLAIFGTLVVTSFIGFEGWY